MSEQKSTLYTNCTIITINSSREVILNGYILVVDSRITSIGKATSLPDLPGNGTTISLQNRIVIPGLINTHAHLAQSLLRGLAEDLPLHSWLCDAIWPLEASYDEEDGYVAAKLTIAEMLKSGTTCFLEAMLTHRSGFENVVRAVGESGIRGCLGKLVKFEESNKDLNITDPRDKDISSMSISSMLSAHEKHHGSFNDRLHVWAAAGTPRGSPLSSHLGIGKACRKHDIGLTMHCAEAPKDLTIYKNSYGLTPMEFCQQAKLTGPKTVLAHMVHLDLSVDLPILKETRTTVAHNPNSNCKLASGIAKVPEMLDAGVNVSLGTDGAPCGNTYDMFREMHLAGIIHKGAKHDAGLVGAETVLEMATINGARALGLEKEIGSLEVGKKADFVVVNPSGLHTAPYLEEHILDGGVDPMTTVVYSCTGADVEMVVVDGEVLVQDGKLVTMDGREVIAAARKSIKGIRERSGVKAVNRKGWKYV
ncbi:5-methylthioadenosine/S-adenosylhomocysteine deaminase n1 [Mollisia scopiformis]|uniref:5-methylthioadenosine/S-adenosylhomocysteine deaminase n1 n=1 Tax=Mollisia scopiformis TaxID=149040 RepID=A0A194XHP3_MOLSC|nr:5-methylthioadenosine/S-adenosylhomocysteine deaminase n1 [Mollisia scopiformis]KUJ19678.1 5-methylthioadenosine/S-adenosylhomocysteine deaminase n1 [Mollisia scopiformis]